MSCKNYSIKNFIDATTYLDSFINYEKKVFFPYAKTLKLQRVKCLLDALNIDYKKLKCIHLAGTKGKGSTATFCAYLLSSGGYKIGLYTSPHFFDFRERIQVLRETRNQSTKTRKKIKKCLIPKNEVVGILKEMQPQLEKLRFTRKLGKLSFFEVYTALAFKYFLKENLDFVVLETGLGGELDATNVVNPLVSIITHIGYDHTDKLGNTLSEIAAQKAGIIKKNVEVISAPQKPPVLKVFKEKSRKLKSKLFVFGKDFKISNTNLHSDGSVFDFHFGDNELKNLRVSLKGKYQLENASLALTSMFILREKGILDGNIKFKEAISNSFIEGRFEILKNNPLIIVDIAHNQSSFTVLRENLDIYYPSKKIILVFAASEDKDIRNMIKRINYQHIILTRFNNPRTREPLQIQQICKLKNALIANDVKSAIALAKSLYKHNSLILVSGSLFLVSEAKELLQSPEGRKTRDEGR